ncbi:MAG: DpnI domain-containing protein, partial [Candidatus Sungbacteria bacterium]|nr:DpnI domain-containing protein [Candidatus Sungbacteria bacterium]
MKLTFDTQLADNYTNLSQKVRVLTESWVGESIFCPNCGCVDLERHRNNQAARDFYCKNCCEDYELKSKKDRSGDKILDGAYRTMIQRLSSGNNPNFFFLNYDVPKWEVISFCVIPKHFFVPEMIEERKPLSPTAHRANYIGCNILLNNIPQTGKIFFVRDGRIEPK